MSNWTHVAGTVRLDQIRMSKLDTPDFDEIFGKECTYGSAYELWDAVDNNPDKFLPLGSEGTLQKSVWINPDLSHVSSYTVSIFGDLRDHDNPDEIIEWFKNKCKDIHKNHESCSIRQACVTVRNEVNGIRTYTWEDPGYCGGCKLYDEITEETACGICRKTKKSVEYFDMGCEEFEDKYR